MPYRNKVYVAFDGDNDMIYYSLLKAWNANRNIDFSFYNAHDINYARDSSKEESIKKQLRVRLQNTKVLVFLIGANTRYLYKFVRWELEEALKLDIPIIAVNLNGKKSLDINRCPAIIREKFVVHIGFNKNAIKYAIDNWPQYYHLHKTEERGPMYYRDEVYNSI